MLKSLTKFFTRSLKENKQKSEITCSFLPEKADGIFSCVFDGCAYDVDFEVVKSLDRDIRNKTPGQPRERLYRVMHMSTENGCIWVMLDGTSISMTGNSRRQ